MAYTLNQTGVEIQTILDDADEGNIGKTSTPNQSDVFSITAAGFHAANNSTANIPQGSNGTALLVMPRLDASTQLNRAVFAINQAGNAWFNYQVNGVYQNWKEIWNDGGTGITAAEASNIVQNCDVGNMGKFSQVEITNNLESITNNMVNHYVASAGGKPTANSGRVLHWNRNATEASQLLITATSIPRLFARTKIDGSFEAPVELYSTGNTGVLRIDNVAPDGTEDVVQIRKDFGGIQIGNDIATSVTPIGFFNPNGQVGGIVTSGTSTAYNVSSDPRLKTEFEQFNAQKAWNCFDKILDASGTFNFKSDLTKTVWGFDAHKLLDAGFDDIASEGTGPRDLALNDVFEKEVIPAVIEKQAVMETVKVEVTPEEKDEDGNVIVEAVFEDVEQEKKHSNGKTVYEDVEVKAEEIIEHKTTPAGVDQAKVVPYLVAVIADLRERIEKLEGSN